MRNLTSANDEVDLRLIIIRVDPLQSRASLSGAQFGMDRNLERFLEVSSGILMPIEIPDDSDVFLTETVIQIEERPGSAGERRARRGKESIKRFWGIFRG